MNGNERSTDPGSEQDVAPDLSTDGWPDRFAQATVRRGRPPSTNPKVLTTIPPVTGRDRALQGGRSRMADAHRRGLSQMDRETRRRLNARRRRAVQRAVRCRPGVGMAGSEIRLGEHDRIASRVVLGKRRLRPIVCCAFPD